MEQKLRWCAGRFIYPRGSAQPVHFLPFKDFNVDDGVEFARLFALRALRAQMKESPLLDEQLLAAMKETAEDLTATLGAELMRSLVGHEHGPVTVSEFYPGAGVLFEYLKLLLEQPDSDGAVNRRLTLQYRGWGEESFRTKFNVLHDDDAHQAEYSLESHEDSPELLQTLRHSDLVIYNHAESVRHRVEPQISLEKVVRISSVPTIIMVRVTTGDGDQEHTTVKGRALTIPPIDRVLEVCRDSDPHWLFKFVPDFDSDFFLPGAGPSTGLVLGYTARQPLPIQGFEPIEAPAHSTPVAGGEGAN